jgi:hypothetical protein
MVRVMAAVPDSSPSTSSAFRSGDAARIMTLRARLANSPRPAEATAPSRLALGERMDTRASDSASPQERVLVFVFCLLAAVVGALVIAHAVLQAVASIRIV